MADKKCSFTYSATTYTYIVDRVSIASRATGRQERLISGDMDTSMDDIEFVISVVGMFEQVGASSKSANQLWLDALGGADISFKSDTDDSTSYSIVPDLAHAPEFVNTDKGTYLEVVELRFISKSVYQETDSVATGIAALRPHYGA